MQKIGTVKELSWFGIIEVGRCWIGTVFEQWVVIPYAKQTPYKSYSKIGFDNLKMDTKSGMTRHVNKPKYIAWYFFVSSRVREGICANLP